MFLKLALQFADVSKMLLLALGELAVVDSSFEQLHLLVSLECHVELADDDAAVAQQLQMPRRAFPKLDVSDANAVKVDSKHG